MPVAEKRKTLPDGLLKEILSSVFPRVCPLCKKRAGSHETGFCARCTAGFRLLRPPFCRRCGESFPSVKEAKDILCGKCLSALQVPHAPDFTIRSVAEYAGTLRRSILLAKYGEYTVMAASLGMFLAQHVPRSIRICDFDKVVPVPLHPRRLRERGFNQCILLAKPLAKSLHSRLDYHSVKRVRFTPSQSASGRRDRRRNLMGAFHVSSPSSICGRSILIVDDVYTTGATLENLARTLLATGAEKVSGLTLARSPAASTWGIDAGTSGTPPSRETVSLDIRQMLD